MAARSKARKRALDILFEAEIRGDSALSVLEARIVAADPPITPYAIELVRGVECHRRHIDQLIAENSRGWALERMPGVDRNILRIGAYELLWGTDVPDAVAISEAVLLATDLSTDASPAFVNGLLARLLAMKPELLADSAEPPGAAAPDNAAPGNAAPDNAISAPSAPSRDETVSGADSRCEERRG